MLRLPTKKCLLCFFISRSRSLSPFFSLSFAGLPPTLNTDTETISASVFVFIESSAAYVLQDVGGYAISRQNNLVLHLGCHTCWLSYFTLVCLQCGRTVSRSVYGHVITKFSWMGRLPHFLTHGGTLRSLRA